MDKKLLACMVASLSANTVMAHMREVAYKPVTIKDTKDTPLVVQKDLLDAAEAKRLRKQARNIKNAQKHTS